MQQEQERALNGVVSGAVNGAVDGAVQLLSQLVAQSLQPVVEHLEQGRRQQLGLHRVLMQVATRMQEQIDAQRIELHGNATLRADEIDKAFLRMQSDKSE